MMTEGSPASVRIALTVFRALTRIVPARIRQRHEGEMAGLLERLLLEAYAEAGVLGVGRVWLSAVADLLVGARGRSVHGGRHSRGSWLRTDLRYAIRSLIKNPGLSLLTVLSLSVGVGVTVATFTFADHVLWEEWSFHEPERVVQIFEYREVHRNVAWANYSDIAAQAAVFEGTMAAMLDIVALGEEAASDVLYAEMVSANYFDVLGGQPFLGGLFSPATIPTAESPLVTVLSHYVWETTFGADPGIVGKTVTINGHPATVVGVARPDFSGSRWGLATDLWVPAKSWAFLQGWGEWTDSRSGSFTVMARLADGASLATANSALETIGSRLAEQYPETNRDLSFRAFDRLRGDMGPEWGVLPDIIALLAIGVAGLVLLVGCGNVASLLLARGVVRQREIAVRMSLGAGRARVARQLLTESLLLATVSAGLGIGLAFLLTDYFSAVLPTFEFRTVLDANPGSRALVFGGFLVLVTVVAFGVAPVLQSFRIELVTAMRSTGGRSGSSAPRNRLLGSVVVGMVALSSVALFLAGVFGKNLAEMRNLEPGFATQSRVLGTVPLQLAGYEWRESTAFYEELEQRIAAVPGVRSAGYGSSVPLGDSWATASVYGADREYDIGDPGINAWRSSVSDSYFATMGTRIVRGRGFNSSDGPEGPWAAVVNEAMADQLWPGEDALEKSIRFGLDEDAVQVRVVGIAEDGMYYLAGERSKPAVYASFRQWPSPQAMVVVETESDDASIVPAVRAELRAMDPDVPLFNVRTIRAHVHDALWLFRMGAELGLGLSVLALILAASGLYGVMAFTVGARRHEMGVRVALGATRQGVATLVLRRALTLTVVGVGVGLLIAVVGGEVLRTLIMSVQPRDPVIAAGVVTVLVVTSALASLVPALRASRSDPVEALKAEG